MEMERGWGFGGGMSMRVTNEGHWLDSSRVLIGSFIPH